MSENIEFEQIIRQVRTSYFIRSVNLRKWGVLEENLTLQLYSIFRIIKVSEISNLLIKEERVNGRTVVVCLCVVRYSITERDRDRD